MNKPLRKRHLQIWTLLAVLIPVGMISAYQAVPAAATSILLRQEDAALPLIVKTAAHDLFTATLRSSKDGSKMQLQLQIKKAATQPSLLLYQQKRTMNELAGRLGAMGTYYFPVSTDSSRHYHFILYDFIHQQNIDSINFNP